MIARYNARQAILAVLSCCIGLCAFAVAWLFFYFAAAFSIRRLGGDITPIQQSLIAWGCIVLIAIAGFLHWRRGTGRHHFGESGMLPGWEARSGLGLEIQTTANRVGAWAYMLGQIFLSGPLQILRAYERLASRIPDSPNLERELLAFRDQLREKKRWLPISDFAGRELDVTYLARLGLVDWSPSKGTLKAR